MKIRTGFVSNSSSSSFVISKDKLTDEQCEAIRNHIEVAKEKYPDVIEYADESGRWTIEEDDKVIRGSTFMNNFDMYDFMLKIGIKDPPECDED